MKEKLILIGNGMAGVRTLEELLKLAPEQYDITVFGGEPYGNYNRILLSPVLAGEKTIDEIMLNDEQWYADNGVTLHKGKWVEEVNRATRMVRASDECEAGYDRLIIATGSSPFIIPVVTGCVKAILSMPLPGKSYSPWMMCAPIPRRPVPAVPVPAWYPGMPTARHCVR